MKTSLIISVYNNILFLRAILDGLRYQTIPPDEVIVSEDGNCREMHELISAYKGGINLVHLTQEDDGWQKNKALNKAIVAASHDYLIFIDGDCVLHTRFIENHIRLSHTTHVLAGKRIKLGPRYSDRLMEVGIVPFQRKLMWRFFSLVKDNAKFIEEALYIPVNWLTQKVIAKLGITSLKGCNFSCYKAAMIAINGFDEDYVRPAVGEDHDLVWRFEGLGYRVVSVKHFAVQYHLHHRENWISQEENLALYREKRADGHFACLNGIKKMHSQQSGYVGDR